MHFLSDAVSGAVCKIWSIAFLCNVISGCFVHITETCTWFYCRNRPQICLKHGIIHFSCLLRSLTDKDGSRHIRAISILLTANIKHNRISCFADTDRICHMMWICRICPISTDWLKRISFCTQFQINLLQFFCQLLFCHPLIHKRYQSLHCHIIQSGSFFHFTNLICIFDLPNIVQYKRSIDKRTSCFQFHQTK